MAAASGALGAVGVAPSIAGDAIGNVKLAEARPFTFEALKDAGTEVKRVTAVGGGSKSELWLKIIATVLGGLGSLSGAVLGGFVVGIVEVFLQGYLPESVAPYRESISLSIIIGLLVMRPDGLWPAQNVNRS